MPGHSHTQLRLQFVAPVSIADAERQLAEAQKAVRQLNIDLRGSARQEDGRHPVEERERRRLVTELQNEQLKVTRLKEWLRTNEHSAPSGVPGVIALVRVRQAPKPEPLKVVPEELPRRELMELAIAILAEKLKEDGVRFTPDEEEVFIRLRAYAEGVSDESVRPTGTSR